MPQALSLADRQRDALRRVAELEAEDARLFARRMELRAEMAELWTGTDGAGQEQFAVLELAGTARIGQTRAATQLGNGPRLKRDLPGTMALLHQGRMYKQTAELVLELTRNCTSEVTREVERRLLPQLAELNTTDARRQIAVLIPQVEAELDPALTEQRLKDAAQRRRVWMSELPDSNVGVGAELGPLEGRRWSLDFEELVRAQRLADLRAGVLRTADERRAAVFAQLPSRMLALLRAIQQGEIAELLAVAQADPRLAEQLEALAQELPAQGAQPAERADVTAAEPSAAERPETDELESDAVGAAEAEPGETDDLDLLAALQQSSCAAGEPARPLRLVPQPFVDEHPFASDPPAPAVSAPPTPPEPPPPPATESEWAVQGWRELAAGVLRLPVHDPKVLSIHVPMSSAVELDQRAATVDSAGVGAVVLPAAIARAMICDTPIRRVVVDVDSGVPIDIDPVMLPPVRQTGGPLERLTLLQLHEDLARPFFSSQHAQAQHDPNPVLRALVHLRDQRCIGIGCSTPGHRCHQDHELAYPGGPTAFWNLSDKSPRCHRAKHAGWTVTRHDTGPESATITWTSPLGHGYTRPAAWTSIAKPRDEGDPPD